VGIIISVSLFVFYTRPGDLIAAVGVTFDPSKDPFESKLLGAAYAPPSPTLYQNSLPVQFKSWTWEATADWRSSEEKKEGTYALKAAFQSPGGTVGMNGPTIDAKNMQSISLSVRGDKNVGDVYLEVYDKNGMSLGQQSLGWYTASGALAPDTWQDVRVPLSNFTSGSYKNGVSGFSISGKNPGVAYVDDVELSKTGASHSVWVAPPDLAGRPFNPFATSTPASLPYTFSPSPESLAYWYSYFGVFGPGENGQIIAGPSAKNKTTGSMTVFRGGRNWSDYAIDATIDWGQVSVFSLLSRVVDDGNFVSCAFSRYGESVQLYQLQDGASTLISQTPGLAVSGIDPWVGVNMGMQVKGNRVSCLIRGDEVLSATVPSMPASGSVGLETWDSNPEAAPHTFKAFTVKPLLEE
jgi:hypothetical protein